MANPVTSGKLISGQRALALVCIPLTLSLTSTVRAQGLTELLLAAQTHDAAYRAAQVQFEAVGYQVKQAYALMRPTINAFAQMSQTHFVSSRSVPPAYISSLGPTFNADIADRSAGLEMALPLIDRARSAQIDQAEQSLRAAQAELDLASNSLAVRLTQDYFDVLAAQDVLNVAKAYRGAMSEQLLLARRTYDAGNATITDIRESQARFDLATAQEIAASDDLRVRRIALDQLVGRNDTQPSALRVPVLLDGLSAGAVAEWVSHSDEAPAVRRVRVSMEVARLELEKSRDASLPTLDAVADLARRHVNSNQVVDNGQSGTDSAFGLRLRIPLYEGGAIDNRIKEVGLLEQKAELDLEDVRNSTVLAVRQAYANLASALAQAQAYEAAEASARLALEATRRGYRVGVRINKDVLDAQTALSSAQRDLYKARYDAIVGSVRLRQAAGTLTDADLAKLDRLLIE